MSVKSDNQGKYSRLIFYCNLKWKPTIPTTCLVTNLRPLGTSMIFVEKERVDSPSVKKNNFEINDRIKLIYTIFK